MIEGMYTAAAGMAAQQMRLDAVANDLANTSTTAYKSNRVAFRDLLYQTPSQGVADGIKIGTGSAAASIGRNMAAGSLQETGRALDVAVQGPGFIQVKLSDGSKAMTRDGNLSIRADGRLALSSGELLEPPIKLPANVNESDVTISADGTITGAGKTVGKITLVEVRSPGQLLPASNNTFVVSNDSGAATKAANTQLIPSALEGSNTDTASAMVDMIESQRAFQLASRAIKIQDQAWEIANQLKRN